MDNEDFDRLLSDLDSIIGKANSKTDWDEKHSEWVGSPAEKMLIRCRSALVQAGGKTQSLVDSLAMLSGRCLSLERTNIMRTAWCHQMAEALREAGLEDIIPEMLR